MTAYRYLDALARAAGWGRDGSVDRVDADPALPARPRPRSRFEPEPGDGEPLWLPGQDVEETVDGPGETRAAAADSGGGRADRLPAPPGPPAPPAAVVVAGPSAWGPAGRPAVGPAAPLRGGDDEAAVPDGPRPWPAARPARPPDADVVVAAPAPRPRAGNTGGDLVDPVGAPSAGPPPSAPARPVADRRGPVDTARDRDRSDDAVPPGSGGRGTGDDEPAPRPPAQARPVVSAVVDDPAVESAGPADGPAPPPVVVEIGRIEVRIVEAGPSSRSSGDPAATARPALPAPGPTLAEYLAGTAGRPT